VKVGQVRDPEAIELRREFGHGELERSKADPARLETPPTDRSKCEASGVPRDRRTGGSRSLRRW
jgi:hypothetical protein